MSESNSPISIPTIEFQHELPRPEGRPPSERYWLHLLLLVATCFTTLVVGARMEFNFLNNRAPFAVLNEHLAFFPIEWIWHDPKRLILGIPFSATLLTILLAHEMGHYLFCRYYGVRATLPFFIPAPTLIGTLGAVIRIKAPIRSRAALFDIGIAGPIAGFVVAVATLFVAMSLSQPLHVIGPPSDLRLGYPWIFYLVHDVLRRVAPSHPIAALPLSRVYLHPTAVAAWVGTYATALNLLPSGQLDGGHIVYALAPRAHRVVSWMTVIVLVILGAIAFRSDSMNYSWWFWAGVLAIMNILTLRLQQAPDYPEIPPGRWILAMVALIMLIVTFVISPFHFIAR
jgi:membrane-associated protease RseP (regulator of RpoE activity)